MKFRVLFIAALFTFVPLIASADVIGQTNDEVASIATPVLDNILLGFEKNDYVTYSQDFDVTLKEAVSKEKFLQTDRWFDATLGPLVQKEFLGFLQQERMTVVLWKGRFARSGNDVLIKLVMSKRGSKYVVTGLWFQ